MIQGLYHWGGHAITLDSVVATQDSITKIIKEQEGSEGKAKGIGARTTTIKRKSTRMPATND